jgi:hypothetical protein
MPLVILTLRLMWRWRLIMLVAFFIILGHIWLNRIQDAWDAHSQPTIWCDPNPGPRHIPFIPAEQCGGITSCDRLFNGWGTCANPK